MNEETIERLISAIEANTEAIRELTAFKVKHIEDQEDDDQPDTYLDGSSCR